jgi:hypothetical protein
METANVFVSGFHPDHAGSLDVLRRDCVSRLILERRWQLCSAGSDQHKADWAGIVVKLTLNIIREIRKYAPSRQGTFSLTLERDRGR